MGNLRYFVIEKTSPYGETAIRSTDDFTVVLGWLLSHCEKTPASITHDIVIDENRPELGKHMRITLVNNSGETSEYLVIENDTETISNDTLVKWGLL